MSISVLLCIAPGSEEIEVVTTVDLLVRAGINVTIASVASNNELMVSCSRGVKLQADVLLKSVMTSSFDAIILPGGLKGAECLRDTPEVIEKVRQLHQQGKIVAAICAAPALVLARHNLFPHAKMTGFPGLETPSSTLQWVDSRVVYDANHKLLTSRGPGTAMDFALKLIALLISTEKAAQIAEQLILPIGTYDYH